MIIFITKAVLLLGATAMRNAIQTFGQGGTFPPFHELLSSVAMLCLKGVYKQVGYKRLCSIHFE